MSNHYTIVSLARRNADDSRISQYQISFGIHISTRQTAVTKKTYMQLGIYAVFRYGYMWRYWVIWSEHQSRITSGMMKIIHRYSMEHSLRKHFSRTNLRPNPHTLLSNFYLIIRHKRGRYRPNLGTPRLTYNIQSKRRYALHDCGADGDLVSQVHLAIASGVGNANDSLNTSVHQTEWRSGMDDWFV